MRFLQIVTSTAAGPPAPRDPNHVATIRKSIGEAIASGNLIATGAIGKRATSAARLVRKGGETTVEDPPRGAGASDDGWMAGGGYSLVEFDSKEEAIADGQAKLAIMGEGVLELIQVSEMHPPPGHAPRPESQAAMPFGVVPYLTVDGAGEASAFYQKAFAAKEVARLPGEDGQRLMHCHLEINGGGLMLSDNFPEMGLPPVQRSDSYVMQLVVADGDAWWARAIEAGCRQKLPFAVAPWGDKYGQLVDPWGVTWALSSPAKP